METECDVARLTRPSGVGAQFTYVKMLISLRKDHKEHLSFLTTQSPQVLIDFCKLAIDYLKSGPNEKLYSSAAEKLSVDVQIVQNSVYALINLLLLSCKYKLCEADFRDSILTVGFSTEQQIVLHKFYESKKAEITQIVRQLSVGEWHYDSLDWRFEVQVSSRALLHQVAPTVLLDLSLKNPKEDGSGFDKKHVILQTDINNLAHLTQELESALSDSKSRYSRRIQKGLNS